jgi:hypothetical protein
MERPNAATTAWYDSLVPDDPRAVKGKMFAHPCAFVNGHMFFGTFAQTVVARVGEARAAELARSTLRIFEPMKGRGWKEYVQILPGELTDAEVAALAKEALDATASLPPKPAKAVGKASAKAKKLRG